jgi:hypothetical protein
MSNRPDETPSKSKAKSKAKQPSHPGMLGDGTEEQNLNQPGNPKARISRDEVEEAFKKEPPLKK